MKKKIFLSFLFALIALLIPSLLYWKSLATTVILSALDFQYGLSLTYGTFDFELLPGTVTLESPQLHSTYYDPPSRLASARQADVFIHSKKAVQGILDIKRFDAEAMQIDLRKEQEGELNWTRTIRQLAPLQDPVLAQAQPPSDGKQELISTLPIMDIQDFQFHYYDDPQSKSPRTTIRMKTFQLDPQKQQWNLSNTTVSRQGNPSDLLTVNKLKVIHQTVSAREAFVIEGDGLELNGEQIDEHRYDFHDVLKIWWNTYREVGQALRDKKTIPNNRRPSIQSLSLTQLSVNIVPQGGMNQSPGAISILADSAQYDGNKDSLTLEGVRVQEAGQSLLKLNRIAFQGLIKNTTSIERLSIQGGHLDIRQGKDSINVIRAIQRIQNIVESLFPQETQTARTEGLPRIKTAMIQDGSMAWHRKDQPAQHLDFHALEYSSHPLALKGEQVHWQRKQKKLPPSITIQSFEAVTAANHDWRTLQNLTINNPAMECCFFPSGLEIIDAASDWIALGEKMRRAINQDELRSSQNPITLQALHVNNARFAISDQNIDPPIQHRFESMNIQWNDIVIGKDKTVPSPMKIEAAIAEPSPGSMLFQGKISPHVRPLNLVGSATVHLHDLAALEPYLEASDQSIPIRITQGGLRTIAHATILNDQVNGTIDLFLFQPEFQTNQSKWPLQIDQKTIINTLNGMKDKNGTIAFLNNKWYGDIGDPQFRRGFGINDVFWINVQAGLKTVLNIPINLAGKGARMVRKGVDSVGNLFKKLMGNK